MVNTKKMAVLAIMMTLLLSPIAYAASSIAMSTTTASNGGHVTATSIATSSGDNDASAISEAIASENGVVELKSIAGSDEGTTADTVQKIDTTGTSETLNAVINMNNIPVMIPDVEKASAPPCEIGCGDSYTPLEEDDTPCDNGCNDESDDTTCDTGCDDEPEDTPCDTGCDDEPENTQCDNGCNEEPDSTPCNNGCNEGSDDTPCNNGCNEESTCGPQSEEDTGKLVSIIGNDVRNIGTATPTIDSIRTELKSFFEKYPYNSFERRMALEPDMQ